MNFLISITRTINDTSVGRVKFAHRVQLSKGIRCLPFVQNHFDMKQLAIVTVLAFALVSCKDDNNIPKVPVHVALHHQFEEDHVVVKIDEIVLIDGVATTEPSLECELCQWKERRFEVPVKGCA